MDRELVITSDGSHSLYIKEMDEQYHSKHGAIAEANKIFIEYGLSYQSKRKKELSIFEVGFGTGLNALLSLMYANSSQLQIHYDTIEKYPLKLEEVSNLNFKEELKLTDDLLLKLHTVPWEKWIKIQEGFNLYKREMDLLDLDLMNSYDLIYFDAFAPEKQAKMWGKEVFEKLYDSLNNQGVLVTYCVKGEIRRRLIEIGFKIEKLKGPEGGKREVLRAIKY
jgi:tRNA U34 5-methylaminomethyl-2-thiouridine-forming methyltransferase MnmC